MNSNEQRLKDLNNAFYGEQASSFSATRTRGWKGWSRVLDSLAPICADGGTVLDVACGNMRFESYCRECGLDRVSFIALDSCADLAAASTCEGVNIEFREVDVIDCVASGKPLLGASPYVQTVDAGAEEGQGASKADAAVCFGFAHHVPTADLRQLLLASLVDAVRPGGIVALSFWAFMDDPGMASRAIRSTEQATRELQLDLETNDYLLGWEGKPGAYRYCHHFTEREVDALAAAIAPKARVVDRYRSDGRTGGLNIYLVLEVLDV